METEDRTTGANRERGSLVILVGAPDPTLREKLAAGFRGQGHLVLEASDAGDMRDRLVEHQTRTGNPFDLILCGGLFAEAEDPDLAQRLASPSVTRALVLLPSGGVLSTAARAHRLGATAILNEAPVGKILWDLVAKAMEDSSRSAG